MEKFKKFAGYLGCFVLGIVFSITVTPVFGFVGELIFGFEVQSLASFPRFHRARLYSNPGLGDQTLTLEVDGKTVWVSGDAPSGDLKEKLSWDATGHIVTLELAGEKVVVYDALNKVVKFKR